jgi:hypothetical protein
MEENLLTPPKTKHEQGETGLLCRLAMTKKLKTKQQRQQGEVEKTLSVHPHPRFSSTLKML